MRIISLNIDGYKMFNPSPKIKLGKEVQLFIGVNGSGKSSVVEAIAYIFSQVKKYCTDGKERERKFNFTIEYSFTKRTVTEATSTTQSVVASIHHILLTSSRDSGLVYTMVVDEEIITTWQEMYSYLPDNLIFYYAGFCETLESIVRENERQISISLLNLKMQDDNDNVLTLLAKNIMYVKKEHFPLLFILNYIDSRMVLPLVNKEFSIYDITFEFQRPRSFGNDEFAKFYNIQGLLKDFLINLTQHSQDIQEVKDGRRHVGFNLTVEYHRGILEAVEDLPNMPDEMLTENTRYLAFHLTNLLFYIGILKQIHVYIRDNSGKIYSITEFSEGEQQLVTIEAINKILCKDNTILFFDEPDAFLHPQRQREILPHLIEQFQNRFSEEYSQLIITTHSPFVAQSISLDHILIFDTEGENPTIPERNLLSYPAITKGIFNLDSMYSTSIEQKLDIFRQYRDKILAGMKYDQSDFIKTTKELAGQGEEMEVIVARELKQIERLTNTRFTI